MLIEGADATWRSLLEDLFAADDKARYDRGFANLLAEYNYRRNLSDKAEAEQRRKTGAPMHSRLLPEGALEAARSEWEQLTGQAPAEPAEPV